MLSSGCDDRKCRVLLPDGVRIDQAPHVSSWGITMELLRMDPYTMHTWTITLATFHLLRISHIRNTVRVTFHHLRMFHIRRLPSDGKRRAFKLPWSDIFGSADSVHPESFAAILHSADSAYPESFVAILHSATVFS